MNIDFVQILIQTGGIGLASFLVYISYRERHEFIKFIQDHMEKNTRALLVMTERQENGTARNIEEHEKIVKTLDNCIQKTKNQKTKKRKR